MCVSTIVRVLRQMKENRCYLRYTQQQLLLLQLRFHLLQPPTDAGQPYSHPGARSSDTAGAIADELESGNCG